MSPSPETLQTLLTRRSVLADKLVEPGPNESELETLLRCATRAPDHRKLTPWRIQIADKPQQAKLGAALRAICARERPEAAAASLDVEERRPQRAPLLLIVSSRVVPEKAPRIEQLLSCGAVCQNALIAATALGYRAQWLTEWPAYHVEVKALLGVPEGEAIVGFLYIGTAEEAPAERPRPALEEVTERLAL